MNSNALRQEGNKNRALAGARMRVGVLLLHLPVGQRTVRPLTRRQLIHVVVYFTRNVWRRFTRVVELKKQ